MGSVPRLHRNCPPGGSFGPRGRRSHTRKSSLSWSPLTESNRRPSPYHPQFPRFTAWQALPAGWRQRWSDSCRSLWHLRSLRPLRRPQSSSLWGAMPSRQQRPRRVTAAQDRPMGPHTGRIRRCGRAKASVGVCPGGPGGQLRASAAQRGEHASRHNGRRSAHRTSALRISPQPGPACGLGLAVQVGHPGLLHVAMGNWVHRGPPRRATGACRGACLMRRCGTVGVAAGFHARAAAAGQPHVTTHRRTHGIKAESRPLSSVDPCGPSWKGSAAGRVRAVMVCPACHAASGGGRPQGGGHVRVRLS